MLLRLLAVAVVVAAVGVFVAWAMLDNDETEVADPGSPATAGRTAPAHDHGGDCGQATPLGALPPALPAWCNTPLASGPGTFVRADNSWLDEFEHGLSNAEMGQGYLVFDRQGAAVRDSIHFRHNNHWMVDVRAGAEDFGGATMRPDAAFRFQDGKLVIEAEVAAGIVEYQGSAWAEIGVTTAPAPTGNIVDALYAYGLFGGQHSFGCRLQASRAPICALYAPEGTRVWEISHFQHEAPTVFGGGPFEELAEAWRTCAGTDPDVECRDAFRLELTKDSIVLYVGGVKYFEQSGTTLLPDALVGGEVYVYFSDWVYRPSAEVTRFHWDRLAVNP